MYMFLFDDILLLTRLKKSSRKVRLARYVRNISLLMDRSNIRCAALRVPALRSYACFVR